jgi:serine/threonine-protein kinase
MGEVWAAQNAFTGREVALKFLSAPGDDLRRRLQREARACGALHHRNVVDIYDLVHADSGDPVLVLQLLRGETLAELLRRRRRLEPALAAVIGRDIATALAAIHALPIVHRDLKPANIFLHRESEGGSPVIKVLDFGVSKRLEGAPTQCTAVDHAIGSVAYMSPEQILAPASVDSRADIWALGVVLFEMLTGHRPFQGDVSALLVQIQRGDIPPVTRFVRHVDPRLVDVVIGCLRRDRDARLGPAERIAEALDRLVPPGDPWAPPPAPASSPRPSGPATLMSAQHPARVDADDEAVETLKLRRSTLAAAAPAAPCFAPPPPSSISLRCVAPVPAPPESSHSMVSPAPSARRRPVSVAVAATLFLATLGASALLAEPLLSPEPSVARALPHIRLPAPSAAQAPRDDVASVEQVRPESVSDTPPVAARPAPPVPPTPQASPTRARASTKPAPASEPRPAAPVIPCDQRKFLASKQCEAANSSRR